MRWLLSESEANSGDLGRLTGRIMGLGLAPRFPHPVPSCFARVVAMSRCCCLIAAFFVIAVVDVASATDWNQWRGPNRDGVDPQSPELISSLPSEGIMPLWISPEEVPGGGGGWSSPIVAGGCVYLYTHNRSRRDGVEAPEPKYPALDDAEREKLTQEALDQYEAKRREEQIELAKQQFHYYDTIYCVDAATGKLLWQNRSESGHTRWRQSTTPAVVDGTLYWMGADRRLRAIDAATGADLWASKLPYELDNDQPLTSSVAVADGAVVVLAGRLIGVDAASGKVLWYGDEDATGNYTSPVVWNDGKAERIVVHAGGKWTLCIQPRTGKELWRVESGGGRSTPVVAGNRLITYSSSRRHGVSCFALSADRAERLWTFHGAADQGSSPVVVGDYVYAKAERRLVCIDLETGKGKWQTTLMASDPRYTSLVAGDDKVILASQGVLCFAATPEGFQPLFQAQMDETRRLAPESFFRQLLKMDQLESTAAGQEEAQKRWRSKVTNFGPERCVSPALVDGRLYLRTDRRLVCYQLSKSAAKRTAGETNGR